MEDRREATRVYNNFRSKIVSYNCGDCNHMEAIERKAVGVALVL
jgi:hypothetical protein